MPFSELPASIITTPVCHEMLRKRLLRLDQKGFRTISEIHAYSHKNGTSLLLLEKVLRNFHFWGDDLVGGLHGTDSRTLLIRSIQGRQAH